MTKVAVDQELCVAAGSCVMSAPEVFDQRDEDGVVQLVKDDVAPEEEGGVREAVEVCPARAIRILG
jgi:ferredoxin